MSHKNKDQSAINSITRLSAYSFDCFNNSILKGRMREESSVCCKERDEIGNDIQ